VGESPIRKTMDEMLAKLKTAIQVRAEVEQQIAEFTDAIKALAKVIDDEEVAASYLISLDEVSGKPGFLDAIRYVLRTHSGGLTPTEIRSWITISKKMDLSSYTNPMASVHTTLRRMKDSDEVEEFRNGQNSKAYRLKAARGALTPPPGYRPIPMNTPAATNIHQAVALNEASKKKPK
jgi:hypothetical protein